MLPGYCILSIGVMTINKWILGILFITGLIILLLPDHRAPVIELNERHGPSFQDMVGLVLILISWGLSCIVVVRKWKAIKSKIGDRNVRVLVIVYILSITGVVLSLLFSSDLLLWSCAAIGFFINIFP